jgi:hypothetical protein
MALRGGLLAVCLLLVLVRPAPAAAVPTFRGLEPVIPEAVQDGPVGLRYVDLPPGYWASLYQSPTDDRLLAEWFGGTELSALGRRYDDGRAHWQLVRDPVGNEGWIGDIFLSEQPPVETPPDDEAYLAAVTWDGEIIICANPAGGPPGLDGEQFVALVQVAVDRWQRVTSGILPLRSAGRCEANPNQRGDGVNVLGWTPDLGLIIAGQAWPNAESGTISELDIFLSRAYFERLAAQRPSNTIRACVLSTLVHEIGHLLGLDHPRSRLLPSSMQAVGAARCDKAMPTANDRHQLLRRYAPGASGQP